MLQLPFLTVVPGSLQQAVVGGEASLRKGGLESLLPPGRGRADRAVAEGQEGWGDPCISHAVAREPAAAEVGGGERDRIECPRHIHVYTQDLRSPSPAPQQVQ